MTFPDWGATLTAAVAFIAGLIGFGRLQQRVNHHDAEFATVTESMVTLETKMDKHTETSAEQWGQVQRALGRLEGHFGTTPVKKNDG